jgi:hypothetical protein
MSNKRKAEASTVVEDGLSISDSGIHDHTASVSGVVWTWEVVEGHIATSFDDAVNDGSYQIVVLCKFLNAARKKGSDFREYAVSFFSFRVKSDCENRKMLI